MKDFDLAAAKRGATVCTRDGFPAYILSFHRHEGDCKISCPIVAEIFTYSSWDIVFYATNGKYKGKEDHPGYDLMMEDDDYLEKLERGEYDHIEDNLEKVGKPDHIGEATEMVDWENWRMKYAGMAMQGFCRESTSMNPASIIASLSVEYADALIEELKNRNKKEATPKDHPCSKQR